MRAFIKNELKNENRSLYDRVGCSRGVCISSTLESVELILSYFSRVGIVDLGSRGEANMKDFFRPSGPFNSTRIEQLQFKKSLLFEGKSRVVKLVSQFVLHCYCAMPDSELKAFLKVEDLEKAMSHHLLVIKIYWNSSAHIFD